MTGNLSVIYLFPRKSLILKLQLNTKKTVETLSIKVMHFINLHSGFMSAYQVGIISGNHMRPKCFDTSLWICSML